MRVMEVLGIGAAAGHPGDTGLKGGCGQEEEGEGWQAPEALPHCCSKGAGVCRAVSWCTDPKSNTAVKLRVSPVPTHRAGAGGTQTHWMLAATSTVPAVHREVLNTDFFLAVLRSRQQPGFAQVLACVAS